jgi:hypothetical protein
VDIEHQINKMILDANLDHCRILISCQSAVDWAKPSLALFGLPLRFRFQACEEAHERCFHFRGCTIQTIRTGNANCYYVTYNDPSADDGMIFRPGS